MGTVGFAQSGPCIRLGGLHPGQHIGREQRTRRVVALGIPFCVQPAVSSQVIADVVLEFDFFVQCHAGLPRTILEISEMEPLFVTSHSPSGCR
jgi:hypothetical protein